MSGLGPFGAGLSPEDTARLLASLNTPGGMTLLDPGATVYARPAGGDNVWTARAAITGTVAPTPQALLNVQGRAGIARRWCVQVRATHPNFPASAPGLFADFVRFEWVAGFAACSADLDLPAGGLAFEVYAQSLSISYAFTSGGVAPSVQPREVVATVSPILGGQQSFPGMYPTRTVLAAIPAVIGAGVQVLIPRFASALSWVLPPIPAAAVSPQFQVDYRDENGGVIANGRALTEWQQLPNGAANLLVSTNPFGAATTLAAVFRLSL